MEYYYLGDVSWQHSQALYHAAAYLGREMLIMLAPATPYVCIGFHQDASQEIDLDFAKQNNIPVFRREVGGGAVYLDGKQLFFQLILNKDHTNIPQDKAGFYRTLLQPVIDTYRQFGVAAEYKPVNDIIANGRKVSGTGAAEIGDSLVLVGNFILDFNYEMMSKVLKVPDEKFRDKVFKTLSDNMSTFLRETGKIPDSEAVADDFAKRLEPLLGPMTKKTVMDPAVVRKADDLIKEMDTSEWLLGNDRRGGEIRQVKIREDVYVVQAMRKTPGGLVRVSAVKQDNTIEQVHISGDFFFYPAETLPELERSLQGIQLEPGAVLSKLDNFYKVNRIESPGLTPVEFSDIIAAMQ
jgi:lipoate-protein ligase A